jgi:hypothetical protein
MVHCCFHEALLTVVGVVLFAAAGCLVPEDLNRYLGALHLAKGGWLIQVEVFGYHHQSCCLVLAVEEEELEMTLYSIGGSTEG